MTTTHHIQSAQRTRFSVVVPVLNSLPFLVGFLDSVRAAIDAYDANVDVIAVDNGSTDGSYELLTTRYGTWVRAERSGLPTIAALRNHGARHAHGDYVCFLDSDVLIPSDYFLRAEQVIATWQPAATGCAVTVPANGGWIETTWARLHRPRADGDVHYLNSGNFVVRAEAFEAIGGFAEALVTGEDAEIGQRLLGRGYRIYQARAVEAVHLRNPKTLRAFFRKEVWHGLGMFGTVRAAAIDKPVAMTLLHGLLNLLAIGTFAFSRRPWVDKSAFLLLATLAVPVAAVAYRYFKARAWPFRPLRSVVLYHVYFDARLIAMLRVASERLGRNR